MLKLSRKGIVASVAIGIVVLLAGAGIAYFSLDGGSADASPSGKNYAVYKDDRTIGAPSAPVVLIEYAAPTCPHCAHFNATVLPSLKKDYIDTGKVLYVLRVFPISPVDGAIEMVARNLPKDKYFGYIDFLFRNQPQWDPEYGVTDVKGALTKLSAQAGVDAAAFARGLADKNEPDRINRIAQDGQMRYNINAVPTIVLNGTPLPSQDASSYPALKAKIDAILAKK